MPLLCPFNDLIGLNFDIKNAGYIPEIKPNKTTEISKINQKKGFKNGMEMSFPERSLKKGIAIVAIIKANTSEMKDISPDSVKNCLMISILLEPSVLRIPTSLALFNE